MAPRFVERMQRQSETLKELYGMPRFDPPPYRLSSCTASSTTTGSITSASSAAVSTSTATTTSGPLALPSYQQATQRYAYKETPCVPRGSRVLVTGANSQHAMHVIKQLLNEGYRVRGAVRDATEAAKTIAYFQREHDHQCFEAVLVPDMAVPGAYNAAVKGCSGIIHAAAVRSMSANPYEVIPQTIMGALNMLEAASREPRIRRVVHCSSVLAAKDQSSTKPLVITSDSWNMAAFRLAWEVPPYKPDRAQAVLASATMQTEQTVWKWYREKKPSFVLNCVLPDALTGEHLWSEHEKPLTEHRHVASTTKPESDATATPQHYADIEDSAIIHLAALILPGVMNERLFVTAGPLDKNTIDRSSSDMSDRSTRPDYATDMTCYEEASRAEELLIRMRKSGWTDLNTSIRRASEDISND